MIAVLSTTATIASGHYRGCQFCLSRWRDLNPRPLPYQGSALPLSYIGDSRAEDEAQTRDPQLGRLMLYQLSYFREVCVGEDGFEPPKVKTSRFTVCPIWPLWYSPVIFIPIPDSSERVSFVRASCRIRTNDPEITNHVLWPTELKRRVFICLPDCLAASKAMQSYDYFFNPPNIFKNLFAILFRFQARYHATRYLSTP